MNESNQYRENENNQQQVQTTKQTAITRWLLKTAMEDSAKAS
jgi:hypothetical protein